MITDFLFNTAYTLFGLTVVSMLGYTISVGIGTAWSSSTRRERIIMVVAIIAFAAVVANGHYTGGDSYEYGM